MRRVRKAPFRATGFLGAFWEVMTAPPVMNMREQALAEQARRASVPASASHSRAVLSADAVTRRLPSGLKAAVSTAPVTCKPLLPRLGRLENHRASVISVALAAAIFWRT
jgi:hypothetical protein